MRVKKYLVETMPEAMSLIRQELGKDAVIVSTKQVKTGGFAGMFRKSMIEVTAAVDENASPRKEPAKAGSAVKPVVPSTVARNVYAQRAQAEPTAASSSPLAKPAHNAQAIPSSLPHEEVEAIQERLAATQRELFKPSTEQLDTMYQAAAAEPSVVGKKTIIERTQADESIHQEIMEMKRMVQTMMRQSEKDAWPEDVKSAQLHLEEQGVNRELAHRLVQQAWSKSSQIGQQLDPTISFKHQLKLELRQLFDGHVDNTMSLDTKIVYLVGPTGVGKTTTIAKLAAEQLFKHRRKVGFITSDTYRIAAVEQLRTYASILNAPIEVVTSPNDIQRAKNQLNECDLILVDTAGRNYKNELYVNELYSMIKPSADAETFLVLSLTMKSSDMFGILERFKHQSVQRIVFTKADETDTYGVMANLADQTSIPFSYVTFGQNVPDDVKPFHANEWADKLLGE